MSVKNMKKSEKGIKNCVSEEYEKIRKGNKKLFPLWRIPIKGKRILSVSLPKIRLREHDTSPLVRYSDGEDSCDPKVKNVGNKIVEPTKKELKCRR